MNLEKLKLLISQDEGATLEFKQEWYKLEGSGKKQEEGELIKDILSLANGNVYRAGEPAYLIIGVSNERNEDGSRNLFDVGEKLPSAKGILDRVRAKSEPPIESIQVETFCLEGKQVIVVTIPFTPHLYETTCELNTPKRAYSEHVVFMRAGDKVDIASAKEREAIRRAKNVRFTETQNVPPIPFGIVVGALTGAIVLSQVGEKITNTKEGNLAGLIAGFILGAIFGGSAGYSMKNVKEIIAELRLTFLQRK